MKQLSVGICGCGIGGLALGILLQRAGHEVVAFDQFKEAAPVGSGFLLQPTGLAILKELGLLDTIEPHGRVIERFFGRDADTGRLVLDLQYNALKDSLYGLAVQRSAVFDALYYAAEEAGVEFRTGKTITATEVISQRRLVVFKNEIRSEPFDLVVDALGQRSVLRPKKSSLLRYGALWASLDWPEEAGFSPTAGEQRYQNASKMIGVVPIGTSNDSATPKAAFFWSLKGDDLAAWRERPLDDWKDEVTALWPATKHLTDQINSHDDLTFAQYRHSTVTIPCATAFAHIGDSFHATSPQLGQGANMALLDAYALAQGIEREQSLESAFDHYVWSRSMHVRLFQTMSWAFTPVYQSDSSVLPLLRDYVVAPLAKLPPAPTFLAKMVTGLLGNPLGRLGLQPVGAGARRRN